jgi:hypothetical protein
VVPDPSGSTGQQQKSGLEGILCILSVAEHSSTNAKHLWPMSAEQFGKRGPVPVGGESTEQLGIGRFALIYVSDQPTNILHDPPPGRTVRHYSLPRTATPILSPRPVGRMKKSGFWSASLHIAVVAIDMSIVRV